MHTWIAHHAPFKGTGHVVCLVHLQAVQLVKVVHFSKTLGESACASSLAGISYCDFNANKLVAKPSTMNLFST